MIKRRISCRYNLFRFQISILDPNWIPAPYCLSYRINNNFYFMYAIILITIYTIHNTTDAYLL
jgi:hypothetical protein